MKRLNDYIREDHKFLVKSTPKKQEHRYFPKDRDELIDIIEKRIKKEGPNCDLNDIDVSKITDMTAIFCSNKTDGGDALRGSFNGDISNWDVSNVKYMETAFYGSAFNGDISNWDVSNVCNMFYMFSNSAFNGDISNWDVSNVADMCSMFWRSHFNKDISQWDVSNVTNMESMFEDSEFNGDISNWDVHNVEFMDDILNGCPLENNPPKWCK